MNCEANGQQTPTERRRSGALWAFLLAGLGIGAVLSVMLAPQPGAEMRRRVANKCLDGVASANGKVHRVRLRVQKLMDESQRRVTAAVAAGRGIVGESETTRSSDAL